MLILPLTLERRNEIAWKLVVLLSSKPVPATSPDDGILLLASQEYVTFEEVHLFLDELREDLHTHLIKRCPEMTVNEIYFLTRHKPTLF